MGFQTSDLDSIRVQTRTEGSLRQKGETNESAIGWGWLQSTLLFSKALQLLGPCSQVCSETPTCPVSRSTSTTKLPVSRFRLESKTHEGQVNFASDKRRGVGLASRFCCRFCSKWKGKARRPTRAAQLGFPFGRKYVKNKWISFGKIKA